MRNPTAYLKMRVLGAVDMAEGDSERKRLQAVSQMTFTDEDGIPRQFTWRTISTWLCRYRKHGVTVMEKQGRSDKGKTRKLKPEDIAQAIHAVLPKVHGTAKKSVLYRLCIEQGLLNRSQVARTTFYRLVNTFELLKPETQSSNKVRLAFAKAHANEMWQADTLYGPYVQIEGSPVQTRLIAFLDDASRVCCHGQFFPAENVDTLIEALRAAFYKRGVPACLYVDNGSIYTSKEIIQICARVGCLLAHTPVRDGAAKGKIERFFRTAREQFLSLELDLSTLESLNRQFTLWVEEQYNAQLHSVLGMSPLDRFALDRNRIRFLPPNEANDELFFVEEDRHVRADNTFSFQALQRSASKLHATCRIGPSKYALSARRPPSGWSSIIKASAWERPVRSTPSPMTGLLRSQAPNRMALPARSLFVPKTTRRRQLRAQPLSHPPKPQRSALNLKPVYDPRSLRSSTQSLRYRKPHPAGSSARGLRHS